MLKPTIGCRTLVAEHCRIKQFIFKNQIVCIAQHQIIIYYVFTGCHCRHAHTRPVSFAFRLHGDGNFLGEPCFRTSCGCFIRCHIFHTLPESVGPCAALLSRIQVSALIVSVMSVKRQTSMRVHISFSPTVARIITTSQWSHSKSCCGCSSCLVVKSMIINVNTETRFQMSIGVWHQQQFEFP